MAAATIIEKCFGSDYASSHIYGSWWFSLMWAFLSVAAIIYFVQQHTHRPSLVILHFSFIVILLGAFLTHLTSWSGMAHLRINETSETYFAQDKDRNVIEKELPFKVTLLNFNIINYDGTNVVKDYETEFMIDYETNAKVSMNKTFTYHGVRFLQGDYDKDGRGSILALNYDPYGLPVTYAGYALLFISLLWMLFTQKGAAKRLNILLAVITALFCIFLNETHLMQTDGHTGYIIPVLNSPLFCIHVGIIIMAYILLFAAIFSRRCLFPAMTALAIGIFVGAIWANVSWGSYWSWDPKEVWALITFMIYAVPLHSSMFPFLRNNRNYHIFMVAAFLSILMTYFGCNYLLNGMHSYA
jgi:hypothetical protein